MADGYQHPETRNLAQNMDEKELERIGAECYEAYEADLESRKEWDSMHAEWVRMFYQQDKPKNPPWEGSSDESLPLVAEACLQYSARAKQALFPGRDFVTAIPVGKIDARSKERAERVATHLSWQCTVRDKRYKRNKRRLLLGQSLHGSAFTKTYYDPAKHRWVVENVRAMDLIASYGTGPRDIEEVERKTQQIALSLNNSRIGANKGFFLTEFEPYQDARDETQQALDAAHGIQQSSRMDERECLALEQHTVLDIDGDGVAEPYIVTLDAQSRKVQRIVIRYDTDELGYPTNDKVPVEYFTHYPYIENPDGLYGLGMGHLIAQLNKSANKLLRQTVDAGTLANILGLSGFISSAMAGPQGGELKLQLGKFVKVPGAFEDFAKNIYQMKPQPPNDVLRATAELLMARSDRLASVTEALTGQTDKVMQPTALMALVEQGLQVFSDVYEGVTESWSDELDKIYRINFKFMDPEEYFAVLDSSGAMRQITVGRQDYAPDLQIMPVADPKHATMQQRITKAEAEKQSAFNSPLTMNSPQHLYNAERRYYKAIGVEDIDEILPSPQGQQRVDDPMMENMLVMQDFPVMPMAFMDQHHDMHIQMHMQMLAENEFSELARSMLLQHVQAHERMLKAGGNGQGRNPAMASQPGNPMGAPDAGGAVPGGSLETNILDGSPQAAPGPAGGDRLSPDGGRLM